jgi:hypothetical protein
LIFRLVIAVVLISVALPVSLPAEVSDKRLVLEYEHEPLEDAEGQSFSKARRAVFFSSIVPGSGEYYLGARKRGIFFMILDGLAWTTFAVFEIQGGLRAREYKQYAEAYSGANAGMNGEKYYQRLADYPSSSGPGGYNQDVRRRAYELFPDPEDAEARDDYIDSRIYTGEDEWNWDSQTHREHYRSLHRSSELAYRRAFYTVGVLLLNRFASAIDAAYAASEMEKPQGVQEEPRFGIRIVPSGDELEVRAFATTRF